MSTCTPSRDDLIDTWIELHGDTQALRDRFNLSLSELRAFASDPQVQRELAAWSDFVERGARLQSLHAQQAAARALESSLTKIADPIELRRAATALARIARDMLAPPRAARTSLRTPRDLLRDLVASPETPAETPVPPPDSSTLSKPSANPAAPVRSSSPASPRAAVA